MKPSWHSSLLSTCFTLSEPPLPLPVILYLALKVHSSLLYEMTFLSIHENSFCLRSLFIISENQPSPTLAHQNFVKRLVLLFHKGPICIFLLTCKCVVKSITQTGPGNVSSAHIFLQDYMSSYTALTESYPHICYLVPLELVMCVCLLMKISFLEGRNHILSS